MGEDIPLLPAPDGGPQLDGSPGVIAPGAGVPLDPAEQAGICGGDAVVVVHIQRGQTADVDAVFALLGQSVGELVVQTVDALDDQDVLGAQGEQIAVVLPGALFEVEVGELHRLAVQEPHHVPVELLHIHGPQPLEVVLAVFVPGGVLPVFEVVVGGDGVGAHPPGQQLGRQAVGEGGLSRGGGTGDHHKAHIPPFGDLLGNVADLLLHQGLLGEDHLGGVPLGDALVHLRHIGDVERLRTEGGVVEGLEDLDGGRERPEAAGVPQVGQPQDEAVLEDLEGEPLQIAGVRDHVPVKIVGKILQGVDVDPGTDPKAEQLRLVQHPAAAEELHRVLGAEGAFPNGDRLADQLAHPLLHPVQQGLIQNEISLGSDEQGAADGILHRDALDALRPHRVIKSGEHQKDYAALIGLASRPVHRGDHAQGAVPVQGLVQLTQLSIPVHQEDVAGIAVLRISGDGLIGGAQGVVPGLPVYDHSPCACHFHEITSSALRSVPVPAVVLPFGLDCGRLKREKKRRAALAARRTSVPVDRARGPPSSYYTRPGGILQDRPGQWRRM